MSWNLEEGNILFEKLVDGRNKDKVGVSVGQWKGGLRKDSKMENVGQIRTMQVLCCILRKCNVMSESIREMKLMNDINVPYFKLTASLVLYVNFLKRKWKNQEPNYIA